MRTTSLPAAGSRARRAATAALAIAAALPLALATSARADSIAYVKGGDVWVASPDGAKQVRLTSSGDYADVSQADDGTLIALSGVRLRRLDRAGHVLADFDTPVSDTRPAGARTFYGPFDPAISPDGTKVAYTYYYLTQYASSTCFPPACTNAVNEAGTGYTHADRHTDWDEPDFHKHSGWRFPSWVDNGTTLLSDPTHLPNADVVVDQPQGRPVNGFLARTWFSDDVGGNPALGSGEASRDQRKLAYTTGTNDSGLTLYRVPSFPTAFRDGDADPSTRPSPCYRYSGAVGGSFGTPTFAPDGARVAWAEGDGVHVATVPDFAAGCTTQGATAAPPLVLPGASQPDWGPADVPPPPPTGGGGGAGGAGSGGAGGAGSGAGTPTGSGQGGTGTTGPAAATLTVRARSLRAVLRAGLVVHLEGLASGGTPVVARMGGRVLGRAVATPRAGTASVTLHLSRAGRRALAGRRSARITVQAAGARTSVTLRG